MTAPLFSGCALLCVLSVREFFQDVVHHFIPFRGLQILLHTSKRDTDNVSMMHFRAGILVANLKPHLMHDIDIFGPKSRRLQSPKNSRQIF